LRYRDAGTFLEIVDELSAKTRRIVLSGESRDVYLFCCNIRTISQIRNKFPNVSERLLEEILRRCVDSRIMYSAGDRFLSLAMAPRPWDAAKRIRQAASEEASTTRRGRGLPVVADGACGPAAPRGLEHLSRS
jgi:hypothetical protein